MTITEFIKQLFSRKGIYLYYDKSKKSWVKPAF